MEKSRLATMTEQDLATMRQKLEKQFNPTMFHTKEDREILEKGFFRTSVLPALMSDPISLFGIVMVLSAFAGGMRHGGKRASVRCQAMLGYRVKFQSIVLTSLLSKLSIHKRNLEKEEELKNLKAEQGI